MAAGDVDLDDDDEADIEAELHLDGEFVAIFDTGVSLTKSDELELEESSADMPLLRLELELVVVGLGEDLDDLCDVGASDATDKFGEGSRDERASFFTLDRAFLASLDRFDRAAIGMGSIWRDV